MSADQLSALILDLYAARKDAKDYLDFFVNPDIDTRLEKAYSIIDREMSRSSRGRSTTRITRIKNAVNSITSLRAGPQANADVLLHVVKEACAMSGRVFVKDSLRTAFATLLQRLVSEADAAGMLSSYLPEIEKAINAMPSGIFSRNAYKTQLGDALAEAL